MKIVVLHRFTDTGKETLGTVTVPMENQLFVCKSLERPWVNNQHGISCIPKGQYLCIWTLSERLSRKAGKPVFTYEVTNVPNRAGIRIHSASFYTDLEGCVALGEATQEINVDDQLDLLHSRITIEEFNKLMNKENFLLDIM